MLDSQFLDDMEYQDKLEGARSSLPEATLTRAAEIHRELSLELSGLCHAAAQKRLQEILTEFTNSRWGSAFYHAICDFQISQIDYGHKHKNVSKRVYGYSMNTFEIPPKQLHKLANRHFMRLIMEEVLKTNPPLR